jgi:hypothetical protein
MRWGGRGDELWAWSERLPGVAGPRKSAGRLIVD